MVLSRVIARERGCGPLVGESRQFYDSSARERWRTWADEVVTWALLTIAKQEAPGISTRSDRGIALTCTQPRQKARACHPGWLRVGW